MPALPLNLSSITPVQKKIIAGILVAGGSFWGGIKFCDVTIKAKIGKYEIQIKQLNDDVTKRDIDIEGFKTASMIRMDQARIARKEAQDAQIKADDAEKKYRQLVAQIPEEIASNSLYTIHPSILSQPVNALPPTAGQVADACDEVIQAKDVQITDLKVSNSACFDANAAATQAIAELQANETDLKKAEVLHAQISSGLQKQLESQKRRKWLYFAGGIILGAYADHTIKK